MKIEFWVVGSRNSSTQHSVLVGSQTVRIGPFDTYEKAYECLESDGEKVQRAALYADWWQIEKVFIRD